MLPGARMLFSRRMEKLAYDAEIEFLESTGTQWIDTGVMFTDRARTYRWDITAQSINTNNYNFRWFGGFYIPLNEDSTDKTNYDAGAYGDNYPQYIFYPAIGTTYHQNGVVINEPLQNGEKYEPVTAVWEMSDVNIQYSFLLFTRRNETGVIAAIAPMRIFLCKIYDDGTLVRDLIPVRKGNIGYMYDRVSGRLFGNSGTGEFVLGPDIIDYTAKDYVQDGLVAMWDGIENAGWGVHDKNTTTWKDLIGNLDATAINSPIWGDNHTDTSNGYWSLPSSVREIIEMQSLTAEVAFQPSTSGATIANQGIVGMGNNRSLWLFFGNPPLSGITLNWQVRKSPSIRAWYNSGVFGTDAHSCSVVANNSVCNTYLDSALCTITPDVAAGSATSTDKFYIGMMSDNVDWHTFHGRIHSVRLYSRALTVEEIAHNYEIDKARFGL